jgi:hypothetical protein
MTKQKLNNRFNGFLRVYCPVKNYFFIYKDFKHHADSSINKILYRFVLFTFKL